LEASLKNIVGISENIVERIFESVFKKVLEIS